MRLRLSHLLRSARLRAGRVSAVVVNSVTALLFIEGIPTKNQERAEKGTSRLLPAAYQPFRTYINFPPESKRMNRKMTEVSYVYGRKSHLRASVNLVWEDA